MGLDRIVADTAALVSIDSQNPGRGEGRCAGWVHERLVDAGLEPRHQTAAAGRDNVLATVAGEGEAPRLILLAHMDTVPVGSGWTRDPLAGEVVEGRVWGRGAADMKGGLAVALDLLERLAAGPPPRGEVVLAATVDEEAPEMVGAHALVSGGLVTGEDQVLALEPTGLRLRIAQVGLRWLRLRVHGRMAHAGRASLGVDANLYLARVVAALRDRVDALPYRDPVLGRPLFTCGTFNGGVATNVVPSEAVAELDLRVVPPMTTGEAVELVQEVAGETLAGVAGGGFELELLGPDRPPVRALDDAHVVGALDAASAAVLGAPPERGGADGHEAYTDASMIATLTGSTSCTVWGPGSTDQAHIADEYVEVTDLARARDVLGRMVESW